MKIERVVQNIGTRLLFDSTQITIGDWTRALGPLTIDARDREYQHHQMTKALLGRL